LEKAREKLGDVLERKVSVVEERPIAHSHNGRSSEWNLTPARCSTLQRSYKIAKGIRTEKAGPFYRGWSDCASKQPCSPTPTSGAGDYQLGDHAGSFG
jgi:hypothetical protein